MLGLQEGSPLEMLRQFAVHLDGDMEESFQAAKMVLDNNRGHGTITLYETYGGLTAWVYNIKFEEDCVIDFEFAREGSFYFGYPVAGQQLQKFPKDKNHKKIRQGQNFMLIGEPGERTEFVIPSGNTFKCCYLIVDVDELTGSKVVTRQHLAKDLIKLLKDTRSNRPYSHFGDIDLKTGVFAETIVENRRTDTVGRLLTKGAIASMLASQMEAYSLDRGPESAYPYLSSSELRQISKIGDYVTANIRRDVTLPGISKVLKMNQKKLQSGVRALYGYSVGRYVQNLRLEIGKELIHDTDMKIAEICWEIGISSKSYFSKIFKERFEILPNDYKKSFSKADLFFEVSYRSKARQNLSANQIEDIVNVARKQNGKFGITGCLIYYKGVFFQMMEGPKRDVMRLYGNIKTDQRHFDVMTIHKGTKVFRDFELWDMALLSDKKILNISYQDHSAQLDLGHLMKDIEGQTLLSKSLWSRVRSQIKVSKPSIGNEFSKGG